MPGIRFLVLTLFTVYTLWQFQWCLCIGFINRPLAVPDETLGEHVLPVVFVVFVVFVLSFVRSVRSTLFNTWAYQEGKWSSGRAIETHVS
jgi:hypothetical protein